MKRVVALKVLSAALCKDQAFVQRFQREVVTIARLGHPNIVMAYDADEAEIGHFLVMEFVDGWKIWPRRRLLRKANSPLGVAAGGRLRHSSGSRHGLRARSGGHSPRYQTGEPASRFADGVVKVTDLGLIRRDRLEPSSSPRVSSEA